MLRLQFNKTQHMTDVCLWLLQCSLCSCSKVFVTLSLLLSGGGLMGSGSDKIKFAGLTKSLKSSLCGDSSPVYTFSFKHCMGE